ncbi:MAG: dihydrofolate reductase, partial [Gammaproteobacteria bacterium]
MATVSVFNFMTLNGFYKGIKNDISWHQHGDEEAGFSEENLKRGSILLFGRVTYELMAGYWSTKAAKQGFTKLADGMNNAEKIVFSRTLTATNWENTRLVRHEAVDEIHRLKASGKKNMTILGSGSLASQCADAGLIDEYQLMIDPVAIGEGI